MWSEGAGVKRVRTVRRLPRDIVSRRCWRLNFEEKGAKSLYVGYASFVAFFGVSYRVRVYIHICTS